MNTRNELSSAISWGLGLIAIILALWYHSYQNDQKLSQERNTCVAEFGSLITQSQESKVAYCYSLKSGDLKQYAQ